MSLAARPGPDRRVEAEQLDPARRVRAGRELPQLVLEPLVAGEGRAEDAEVGDDPPPREQGHGADRDVGALARREPADVGQPQRALEDGSGRRGHVRAGDEVGHDPGSIPQRGDRLGEHLPRVPAVRDHPVGEQQGRRHHPADHQRVGALGLVHVAHRADPGQPGDHQPGRDRQRVDVDPTASGPAHQPPGRYGAGERLAAQQDEAPRPQRALAQHRHPARAHRRAAALDLGDQRPGAGQRHRHPAPGGHQGFDGGEQHAVRAVQLGPGMGQQHPGSRVDRARAAPAPDQGGGGEQQPLQGAARAPRAAVAATARAAAGHRAAGSAPSRRGCAASRPGPGAAAGGGRRSATGSGRCSGSTWPISPRPPGPWVPPSR